MEKYTNTSGVSLPLAVWLATDNYDGKSSSRINLISATTLLKSTRQVVLGTRINPEDEKIDVASVVKSRIGSAIHTAIEQAWNSGKLNETLISLGYPKDMTDRIEVNPRENQNYRPDMIPIYMEKRSYKSIGKWTVTGQFDFIFNGHVRDFKSTGVFTYVNETKGDDYIKQLSTYRWLNPDIITENQGTIDFIFTDWKQSGLVQGNYPPAQTFDQTFDLMPISDTEEWIKSRLDLIETCELVDEPDLPYCTDSELWRSESIWKYYKSGKIEIRSTKNFDNAAEAYSRKNVDGGVGLVLEIKGQPTACKYCNVSSICTQKDGYISSGDLVL